MTQISRSDLLQAGRGRPTAGRAQRDEVVGRTSASASGRALVPTAPTPVPESGLDGFTTSRPSLPFLAQLIATALKAPQTCARRRAEPADATAIYAAGAELPAEIGASFRRSL
jgi:hypothetical protein